MPFKRVGVAARPSGAATWEQVIGLADQALYEAKRNGRNQFRSAIPPDAGRAAR